MQYPEDAKLLALTAIVKSLTAALVESRAVDARRLLQHVATARHHLDEVGETVAAEALVDLFDPIADAIMRGSAKSARGDGQSTTDPMG